MKTLAMALAAATALAATAAAGSAAAQPSYDRGWYDRGWHDDRGEWVHIERRKMQLDRRIEQGLRSGQLTPREAMRLRAEFNDIARLEYRYSRNGLSPREMAELDRRFDRLAAQIRWERRDDDRRYGYNNRW
ncbi:hypothetical protein LRS10_08750 [Phenylobacterium sp. J426]|uniref:hypothetical protein n=1 Tax=Phenylobacterium sp. J426 TaxID=2898439 RepID=UPI002151C177|nr:hypothetical protein [Phenylobacterium sp. J426]MCR5874246.1 hypothetical protein [Phenylobacterium sp. J426]